MHITTRLMAATLLLVLGACRKTGYPPVHGENENSSVLIEGGAPGVNQTVS